MVNSLRNRLLLVSVAFYGLCGSVAAQGAYDDFSVNGPLDQTRWYYDGQDQVKQGFFEVRVPAMQGSSDLESTYGFDGFFDLQLEYQNRSGPGKFWLGVYDASPQVPDTDVWIGLRPSSSGLIVEGGGNVVPYHSTVPSANMSAGSLRISRRRGITGATVLAFWYRSSTATTWTLLFEELDTLGPVVMLWIEISGGAQAFQVDFDALKNLGKNLHYPAAPKTAPYAFGSSCHGLHARAVGFPFVNTPKDFILAAWGTSPGASVGTVIGQSASVWLGKPLPIALGPMGFPGCFLHVPAAITIPAGTADKDGEYGFALAVPNDIRLRGLSFSSQSIALDLKAPVGSQVGISNAATFVIL